MQISHMISKYRRMVTYNKLRKAIGQILRTLVERKPGVEIIKAKACSDHSRMLVEIPLKHRISTFMEYEYGNCQFEARRYCFDRAGKNEKRIEEYIQ